MGDGLAEAGAERLPSDTSAGGVGVSATGNDCTGWAAVAALLPLPDELLRMGSGGGASSDMARPRLSVRLRV